MFLLNRKELGKKVNSSLSGKKILIGVSGGIAAFKAVSVASALVKKDCIVKTIMTRNAEEFIRPLTFETITNNACLTSTFERKERFDVEHISLAKWADAFVIVPATANVIAKIANGLADDMLTSTFLACKCTKIVFPSMNTGMLENVATQSNIKTIVSRGIKVVEPAEGMLACGDVGKGRLPEVDDIVQCISETLSVSMDLKDKNILVTAGATEEYIDPIRFLTNRSSGKMGYAIAKVAAERGARVTLVSGRTNNLAVPSGVDVLFASSACDMYKTVLDVVKNQDICILAAAVADYTPKVRLDHKMKKTDSNMVLELVRTPDILSSLREHVKENAFLCGFSMETQDLLENSKKKLTSKNVDMIVANNINDVGAGFGVDTNKVSIITRDNVLDIPLMTKEKLANVILDNILKYKFGRFS